MSRLEGFRALAERDLQRHRRLIDRLRRVLFQCCSAHTCYVVGKPGVIDPHVNVRFDPTTGQPHREILLGGLEYTLELPGGPRRVCVQHWAGKTFWLHASFQPRNTQARFTRFSLTAESRELPRVFSECLDILIHESNPMPPLVTRAKG